MRKDILALMFLGAGVVAGCTEKGAETTESAVADQQLVFRSLSSPADSLARYPHLLADEESGRLWMSWTIQHRPDSASLWLSELDAPSGKWQAPQLLTAGSNLFVNWADYPHLALHGKEPGLLYLQVADPAAPYAYHVMWKEARKAARRLHSDSSATEHGFVSSVKLPNGEMAAIWLDGQKYAGAEGGGHDEHDGHSSGEMTLRFRTLAANGDMLPSQELDGRTCDCCNTALVSTAKGAIAFYRDRSKEEIRDIYYARYDNGKWTAPQPLHTDGWEMRACPVNGPAADALGEQVAAAWFTGAGGNGKVNVRFSPDGGQSWGSVMVADSLQPMGRVGIKLIDEGQALLSWLNQDGQLVVQQIAAQGNRGQVQVLADSLSSRKSGFPQLVRLKDKVYVAWTQPEPSLHIELLEGSFVKE